MPSVSIIIPAYNVERHVRTAVQSAVDQTLPDVEVIVVDDGSTDGTGDLLRSFGDANGRLKVLRQPNRGVSAARNAGLGVATGQYVLFLDGDDQLLPTACASLYRMALECQADMVVSDYLLRCEGGHRESRVSGGAFARLNGREFALSLLEPDATVAVWNKLVRRSVFAGNGIEFPVGVSMAEDFATVFELCCHAPVVVKLDEPTLVYIRRIGGLVGTLSPHLYTVTAALERVEVLLKQNFGEAEDLRDRFETTCYYHVMYTRVVSGRSYGGVHRQLHNWYRRTARKRRGRVSAQFLGRLRPAEKLVSRAYKYGYWPGVLVRRALDVARKLRRQLWYPLVRRG